MEPIELRSPPNLWMPANSRVQAGMVPCDYHPFSRPPKESNRSAWTHTPNSTGLRDSAPLPGGQSDSRLSDGVAPSKASDSESLSPSVKVSTAAVIPSHVVSTTQLLAQEKTWISKIQAYRDRHPPESNPGDSDLYTATSWLSTEPNRSEDLKRISCDYNTERLSNCDVSQVATTIEQLAKRLFACTEFQDWVWQADQRNAKNISAFYDAAITWRKAVIDAALENELLGRNLAEAKKVRTYNPPVYATIKVYRNCILHWLYGLLKGSKTQPLTFGLS